MNPTASIRTTIELSQKAKQWEQNPDHKCTIWHEVNPNSGEISADKAFPIWKHDTVEDVIKKWTDTFAGEAYKFIENRKLENAVNASEKAMTKDGTMRKGISFPETLYHIIKAVFPQYLESPKMMMRLKEYIPICFNGRIA